MTLTEPNLEALEALLERWGYLVIFAAMLLENAGLPLPGETVTLLGAMPPAAVSSTWWA